MIRKIITPLDGDAKIFSNEQIEVIRKLDRSQVERFFLRRNASVPKIFKTIVTFFTV